MTKLIILLLQLYNFCFECVWHYVHICRLSSILNIVIAGNGNGNEGISTEMSGKENATEMLDWEMWEWMGMGIIRVIPAHFYDKVASQSSKDNVLRT